MSKLTMVQHQVMTGGSITNQNNMANIKAPKTRIGILFEVHIDDTAQKTIQAGYTELKARLQAYTQALAKDGNIIISDSYVCINTDVALKLQTRSANTTAERLDAVVLVPKPVAPAPKPGKAPHASRTTPMSKQLGEESAIAVDDDEPPHIVALDMAGLKAAQQATQQAKLRATPVPSLVTAALANPGGFTNEEWLAKAVAQMERRSDKSVTLLTVLIRQAAPMNTDALVDASKLDRQAVTNWLSSTTKKYKFVKSAGRGLYEFDRTAVAN